MHRQIYLGCFFMILGMMCYGIGNAVVKDAAEGLGISQILFIRGIWALLMLAVLLPFTGGFKRLKTKQLLVQSIRGILGYFGLFFLFLSFKLLPLADATVFSFGTVLFVTIFSIIFLKERANFKITLAILTGFCGIMMIVRPTGDLTLYGILVGLLGAFGEGMVLFFGKVLGKNDHPITCTFYHTLWTFMIAMCFAPFNWVSPNMTAILMIGAVAGLGVVGQIFIVQAYKLAPAIRVSPMTYSLVIWGVLFGAMFWDEMPLPHFYVGAAIVILSGIYIAQHRMKPAKK